MSDNHSITADVYAAPCKPVLSLSPRHNSLRNHHHVASSSVVLQLIAVLVAGMSVIIGWRLFGLLTSRELQIVRSVAMSVVDHYIRAYNWLSSSAIVTLLLRPHSPSFVTTFAVECATAGALLVILYKLLVQTKWRTEKAAVDVAKRACSNDLPTRCSLLSSLYNAALNCCTNPRHWYVPKQKTAPSVAPGGGRIVAPRSRVRSSSLHRVSCVEIPTNKEHVVGLSYLFSASQSNAAASLSAPQQGERCTNTEIPCTTRPPYTLPSIPEQGPYYLTQLDRTLENVQTMKSSGPLEITNEHQLCPIEEASKVRQEYAEVPFTTEPGVGNIEGAYFSDVKGCANRLGQVDNSLGFAHSPLPDTPVSWFPRGPAASNTAHSLPSVSYYELNNGTQLDSARQNVSEHYSGLPLSSPEQQKAPLAIQTSGFPSYSLSASKKHLAVHETHAKLHIPTVNSYQQEDEQIKEHQMSCASASQWASSLHAGAPPQIRCAPESIECQRYSCATTWQSEDKDNIVPETLHRSDGGALSNSRGDRRASVGRPVMPVALPRAPPALCHMSVGELIHFFALPEHRSTLKSFYATVLMTADILPPSVAADLIRLPVKLQRPDPNVTEALCRCLLSYPPTSRNLTSMQIALAAWSLARSEFSRYPICFATMRSLADEALLCLNEFQPLSIANMLWACGKLKYRNEALLQGLAKAAVAQLDQFNAQNIANAYWSLGSLEFSRTALTPKRAKSTTNRGFSVVRCPKSSQEERYSKELAETEREGYQQEEQSWVYDVLITKLPSFNSQALANFIWACAKLQWTGENLRIKTHERVSSGSRTTAETLAFAPQQNKTLVLSAASLASRRAHECKPQEISNIMWALAKLSVTEATEDVCRLANHAAATLQHFNSQEVSNAYWAVGTLELRHTQLTPASVSQPVQLFNAVRNNSTSLSNCPLKKLSNNKEHQDTTAMLWRAELGGQSSVSLATPSTTESLGSPLLDSWRTFVTPVGNSRGDTCAGYLSRQQSEKDDDVEPSLYRETPLPLSCDGRTTCLRCEMTDDKHLFYPDGPASSDSTNPRTVLQTIHKDTFPKMSTGHDVRRSLDVQENAIPEQETEGDGEVRHACMTDESLQAEAHFVTDLAKDHHGGIVAESDITTCTVEGFHSEDRALLMVLLEKMQHFNAQAIANLLWSCGKLQWKCEEVCSASFEVVKKNISTFQPQNVANYLWAMAKLRLKNEELVRLLTDHVALHLMEFNTQELANVYWALGTLEIRDSPLTCVEVLDDQHSNDTEIHNTTPGSASAGMTSTPEWVARSYHNRCLQDSRDQKTKGRSTALYINRNVDLSNTHRTSGRTQLNGRMTVTAVLRARLRFFKPQELANFLWACARLKWKAMTVLEEAAETALRLTSRFKPQEIGNVVWALAKLNYRPVDLLEEVCAYTVRHIEAFTAQNIANIYWGLGALTLGQTKLTSANPPPEFITQLVILVKKFNDQEVTNFIWACSRLRWNHASVVAAAVEVFWSYVDRFRRHELASLQFAFRKLGRLDVAKQLDSRVV